MTWPVVQSVLDLSASQPAEYDKSGEENRLLSKKNPKPGFDIDPVFHPSYEIKVQIISFY